MFDGCGIDFIARIRTTTFRGDLSNLNISLDYRYVYEVRKRGLIMLNYNELYELLRKEKYSEQLQQLPKDFSKQVAVYLAEQREEGNRAGGSFIDSLDKSKKQFENSVAIFKELMRIRKKKLLNLVFVATETGLMKRDSETMLDFERDLFEKFVKNFEDSDKVMVGALSGEQVHEKEKFRMVLFSQAVEQFIDMNGLTIGPFSTGELANLDAESAAILVAGGKASFVDDG